MEKDNKLTLDQMLELSRKVPIKPLAHTWKRLSDGNFSITPSSIYLESSREPVKVPLHREDFYAGRLERESFPFTILIGTKESEDSNYARIIVYAFKRVIGECQVVEGKQESSDSFHKISLRYSEITELVEAFEREARGVGYGVALETLSEGE